ncbi:DUF1302 domain-containing protein [Pseudomonas aeruginosa]|uniref:DUF1302 domain-containing protein n=1 Tax=Pseudomonas aeruginosa TaxID=287 RepID=UPI0015BCCF6A|nr:DUF1302 domain-containing protein [Pseudomonas aeruginosa]MBX5668837.1 DUF1302 domain-containing protein [Pseudomonas aeruginosa]MBX5679118.1 DUF1302 domain-containing protein [Pseudomonas aeruginosa]MBX5753441.1 DUF1302 domain-containing protein [Pseudomonas aeruginosa]MBX6073691.1 DUF1302 domain-containing protein [Pseudomonas aeruginosa]MBX6117693.1 DUF1302 domain-containing protein [Pseudomonas aeruginosa]
MLKQSQWRPARLASAISLATLFSTSAQAIDFSIGEIDGQLDSTLSIGASWALRNPDPDLLGSSVTDDGRRNFKKGETFSKIFKGIHDLQLSHGESGVFLRGKYWYDFELKDESRPFKDIDDHGRKTGAQSSGVQLLDAFAYHNYTVADLPGTVRVGKQVVSWGESTFIQGGINSINPVDVAAFRRPGSEIKEALIPVNMVYLSQNITDNLTAEMFYQLEWDQSVIDNCGTFFAPNDAIADGCTGLVAGPLLDQNALAQSALSPLGVDLTGEGIRVPRAGDNDARDNGQWGTALRWFAPELDSEFAAYFMNYHSRMPFISGISSPHMADLGFGSQACANIGISNPALCNAVLGSAQGQALTQAYRLGTSKYFADYPEDIQLYGLSFSTTLATGTTLAGEISYRPNMPIQINSVDIISATTGEASASPVLSSGYFTAANSAMFKGYQRKEMTQAQVTATHFFDQVMGADRLTLVGEVGVTHVSGMGGDGLRYGRSTTFGMGELADNSICTNQINTKTPQYCTDDGFTTSTAWGYRARAIWEYSNLIDGVELKPSLAWSHDVNGYGPEPGFNEGSKAISLGLDAVYLNTYTASLAYTDYFGGDYNANADRDYVALSFAVSF